MKLEVVLISDVSLFRDKDLVAERNQNDRVQMKIRVKIYLSDPCTGGIFLNGPFTASF